MHSLKFLTETKRLFDITIDNSYSYNETIYNFLYAPIQISENGIFLNEQAKYLYTQYTRNFRH